MFKIGIVSDTHGLLRPEVLEQLQGCWVIFHGGDINKQKILDELGRIAPVHVVRGNNDKEWAEYLPESIMEEFCGLRIFMVHNKKFIPKDLADVDLVIYGHSHRYEDKMVGGIRYLNPGSCGPRRFHQEITLAILYLQEDGSFEIQKIVIPHPGFSDKQPAGAQLVHKQLMGKSEPGKDDLLKHREDGISSDIDLRRIIPMVMRDVDSERSVKQIARRHKMPEELTEQIVRMYLTHPGVDVEGIIQRIE